MAGRVDILAGIAAEHEAAQSDRVRIEVPEWGKGVVLFFRRSVTLARRQQIACGLPKDDEEALIASYILHEAQMEDGSPAFEPGAESRAALMGQASAATLMRIMKEIGGGETIEQAKNA